MKDIAKWVTYGGIFLVPFVVLFISNSLFFPFITGKNFAFRILVEIACSAWVLLMFYDAQYRPRFSWVALAGAALLLTMAISDAFGAGPLKSFWSNYERMDGYVTLVHFYAYFLMVGTLFTSSVVWNRFFNTTLAVASAVCLYAFAQVTGVESISQGGTWRVDATLGNSTYMAIYMLFHIAIAVLMITRTQSARLRWLYGALILVFAFILLHTGTRGTTLGLVGGSLIATSYIALFATQFKRVRKYAGIGLAVLLLAGGGFFVARHTEFVQHSQLLSRVANISLADGNVRFMVWKTALQGVKERPVFGWGQENFSFVFNKYYTPNLYIAETWYDRSHDIVMDWLVTGGILGFLAYFSILGAALWYLFVRPLLRKDETFTVVERGILIGLLAGYTIHNLFVFDNIVSYIFYAVILGYIHVRVTKPVSLTARKFDIRVIEQVAAPLVGIAMVCVVYFVNIPSLRAAGDMIDALKATDPNEMLTAFDRALSRGGFGNQEIREQMMQRAQSAINTPNASQDFKDKARKQVEDELLKQSQERPNDARTELFLASFYRANGMVDEAIERLKIARALSPQKQIIIFEQGFAELQKNNTDAALSLFKEAYDSAPGYMDARINYANVALLARNESLFNELIASDGEKKAYALNDQAVQMVYKLQRWPQLIDMFKVRIAEKPMDSKERANLAYVYTQAGKFDDAIAVIEKAITDIPSFKTQGEKFIEGIKAERDASVTSIKVQ